MRGPLLLCLLAVAVVTGYLLGRWSAREPPSRGALAATLALAASTPAGRPAGAPRAPGGAASPAPSAASAGPPRPLEAMLARAHEGSAAAALDLLDALERCAQAREVHGILAVIARDTAATPQCADAEACARLEPVYEEFARAIARLRAAPRWCDAVDAATLERRGEWLERAAASGDAEARACYALAAPELAPPPSTAAWPDWMARWRRQALPWAWQAWREGDPRAALALARIYAPDDYWRGDAADLAAADVRLQYRHAQLLVRALGLAPETSDLARAALLAAESLDPVELSAAGAAIEHDLARVRARLPTAQRTPDDCWQHFAPFTTATRNPSETPP